MTGAERLRELFETARVEERPAFLPFMTAGLPTPDTSVALFEAMAAAGADGFEVGIPYSDPLMDGPVIQRGSDRAIAAGTTLDRALEVVASVVERTRRPALAMTYANPVYRRGVDWFCGRVAEAGADGVIVPDLPVEEAGSLRQAASRHGLGMVLFLAPTSDRARIEAVVAAEPAFVYAVAEMGVTGERSDSGEGLAPLVERIRQVSDVPVVAGVGISTPEQAVAAAGAGVDGIIMGSALVRRVLEADRPEAAIDAVRAAVAEVARALRPPVTA